MTQFPESEFAHQLLDGMLGIEIGASAHNAYNIPRCVYVDYTDDMDTSFKQAEIELCGRAQAVDVVAMAWDLPFTSGSLDYVLSSHVLEHCWDVIGTLEEWLRVLRPGGLIYMDIPHKERTFDAERGRTPLAELVARHAGPPLEVDDHSHHSVWIAEDWREICEHMGWALEYLRQVDDKVGNGFTVVIRKPGLAEAPLAETQDA